MSGSQLLWQMSRVLYLFIYPALRLWVSCHFPVLMLTHLSLHSTRIPSPGPLPALPSKTTLRPWIFFPWVKKQTKPKQENQTKITLFLFWKTQEKNLPGLQSLNLRTLWFLVGCNFLPHYALMKQANAAGPVQGAPPSPKSTQGAPVWKEWIPAKWKSD